MFWVHTNNTFGHLLLQAVMESHVQQLQAVASDYELKEDPEGAEAARGRAAIWSRKAAAAQSQLQEVEQLLDRQRSAMRGYESETPTLLRGEEQQGAALAVIA